MQTILPLRQYGVIRKETNRFYLNFRPVSDKLFPVFLRRIVYRSSNNAKVLRALVGADVEEIVAKPRLNIVIFGLTIQMGR